MIKSGKFYYAECDNCLEKSTIYDKDYFLFDNRQDVIDPIKSKAKWLKEGKRVFCSVKCQTEFRQKQKEKK